jgi:hypothetical protein
LLRHFVWKIFLLIIIYLPVKYFSLPRNDVIGDIALRG